MITRGLCRLSFERGFAPLCRWGKALQSNVYLNHPPFTRRSHSWHLLPGVSLSRFLFLCFVSFFFVAKQRKRNEGGKRGILEMQTNPHLFGEKSFVLQHLLPGMNSRFRKMHCKATQTKILNSQLNALKK